MYGQYEKLGLALLIIGTSISLILIAWFILEIFFHFNLRHQQLEKKILEHSKQWLASKKESEDYKFALDQSSIVAITDTAGTIKHVNNNFCAISKFSRKELIGQNHRILNSGFHPNEFMIDLWTTIRSGNIWRGDIKNKAKDGSYYWVATTIIPFLNQMGVPYQYLVIRSDITDWKKAEQELINSEKHFKALIENAPDVIVLLDKDLKMTYVSPSFEKATGYPKSEIIGTDAFAIVSPEMQEESKAAMEKVLKSPGIVYPRINHFVCKNGSTLWCEGSITNLLNDENIKSIVVNYKDITDKKLAEEKLFQSNMRFKLLIENNYDAILLVNKDLAFFYGSPSVERISGWKFEELKSKGMLELLHPEDKIEVQTQINKSLEHPELVQHSVHRFLNKDGNYFWADATLTNLLGTPGINGLLINMSDISDKKKVEERMIFINEELEEKVLHRTEDLQKTNKELEMFTSSVSHDLRTPLSAIDGFANLLKEFHYQKLNDEGKEFVEHILNSTKRMNRLIEDLLRLSKLGKKTIQKTQLDLNLLMKKVIEECTINLTTTLPEIIVHPLPIICGDDSLMEQVWVNLVSNAIKYSAKKQNAKIEIGYAIKEENYEFYISDNGAGFDMKYADKLFGIFQRMHNDSEFKGNGVGLAIVKLIIEKHNGKIWVDSKPNEGTTFNFYIPNDADCELEELNQADEAQTNN
jgi:PAS domain S-box-containing protein